MQTLKQTFVAPQTWQINMPGKYLVILACTQAVNVRLYLGGKKLDLGDMQGLLSGLEIGPLGSADAVMAFDRVEVDVQADTVQIGIGNGMAHYSRQNGTVDVNSLPAATVLQLIRPEAATGNWASTTVLAAGAVETVFTPAANVNGAIVLTAQMVLYTGSTMLAAKTSAPTSGIDGEVLLTVYNSAGGAIPHANSILPNHEFIPAGKGLYFYCMSAENAGQRYCRYKLL